MGAVGVAEEQDVSWGQLELQKNRMFLGGSWSNRRTGRFMGAVGVAEEQDVSWGQLE